MKKIHYSIVIPVFAALLLLSGCDSGNESAQTHKPVPISNGDECHVCGMTIHNHPGPKGQAFIRNNSTPFKYCSTRDLFSHILQPEVRSRITQIYTHDMGSTTWESPDNSAFTDARQAWYVIHHPMTGAMGPTLASFAEKAAAEEFIAEHGGEVVRFEDITLELVANLTMGNETMADSHQH
ncbi:MAG: nitrous oxide reductase accessory protein NosL [Thiohalophilus sp.]|uniref:nitrous oxide reductase accessory protein NosL n=1 Tax=Thiohalophilus sp. TaxID=3028392 RepID=UPI0028705FF3|nr:nitrous oxide reductase accessory protein NosL [Thiohalophilus sp.]MDR9436998.1 nitrous oxide reductase accessory protein NosL [Thiohalophilus sp.]